MHLKLDNMVFEYENELSSIDKVLSKIEQTAKESGKVFIGMKIDGIEVYQDFKTYLIDNIANIETVEVKLKTEEELKKETLSGVLDYLKQATPEIKDLTDDFYQGPVGETWTKFAQLMEGLQWISQFIFIYDQSLRKPVNWERIKEIYNKLATEIQNLNEAFENSDMILLGDLLNYEIIPCLDEFAVEFGKILDNEGMNDDLN